MAALTPKTILLATADEGYRRIHDAKATVANIQPGHFIIPAAAGVALPAAAQANNRMIAVESPTPAAASEATAAIDIVYPNGDTVYYIFGQPGDVIYAILAPSQVAALNSLLDVTTAGTLAVEATNTGHDVVAIALEAVTTTGAVARIKVRIL